MALLQTQSQRPGNAGGGATLGAQGPAAAAPAAAQRVVPFAQASKHGRAQYYTSSALILTTSQQPQTPLSLPSDGYLRRLRIEVTTSTAGTGGTASADYPASLFALLRLRDTNGAPIFELSGWHTLLADLYGGYAGVPDPRALPNYSASATAPTIQLTIPVEIDPTGVGSLPNLSAQSAFRLEQTLDTIANNYSVSPSPAPTLTWYVWADYWTLPDPQDMDGRAQEVAPPYEGTVQLWTEIDGITVAAGSNRVALTRMGNLLRSVFLESRSAGARSNTVFGDPLTLRWDDLNLIVTDRQTVYAEMREYTNDYAGPAGGDVGVYMLGLYNYGVSRFVGGSGAASWLPTVTATRYEVNSAAGVGSGGTVNWIVNDVTTAPTSPGQRAQAGGGLGYHPPVGTTGTGAM